jgi:hypothetical protein
MLSVSERGFVGTKCLADDLIGASGGGNTVPSMFRIPEAIVIVTLIWRQPVGLAFTFVTHGHETSRKNNRCQELITGFQIATLGGQAIMRRIARSVK